MLTARHNRYQNFHSVAQLGHSMAQLGHSMAQLGHHAGQSAEHAHHAFASASAASQHRYYTRHERKKMYIQMYTKMYMKHMSACIYNHMWAVRPKQGKEQALVHHG